MSKYRFSFPPYPLGWYQVGYSDELLPKQVVPLEYFGRHMVMFRTESGKVSVLDAYCPHLGAHLGYGGTVEGEEVRCPFHAWKFNCEGMCTSVPYGSENFKISPKARIDTWHVVEINGLIMVWWHPEGEAPMFEVPLLEEYGHDDWTPYETRRWKVRTRNQEMAENAVDTAHFHYLHGTQNMPSATMSTEGPIMRAQSTTVMETPMGSVEGVVNVMALGFGFTVVRFTGLVDTILVNSVTAIDEEYCDVRFSFIVKKSGGRSITKGIGMAFVREIERQLEQDIPIWENKKHVKPPILSDGDGPIGKYRVWCRQFYTDPNAQP